MSVRGIGQEEQGDATAATQDQIRSLNAFYFDVARSRSRTQYEHFVAIDGKANTLFTIGSTILPIVAGLVSSDGRELRDSTVAIYSLILALCCYAGMAIAYVLSQGATGKWDDRPEMDVWKEIGGQYAVEDLQRWLGDALVDAYRNNEPSIEKKAARASLLIWFLLGEVTFLSISVVAPIWPNELRLW